MYKASQLGCRYYKVIELVEANLIQVYPSMGYTYSKLSIRPSFHLVACPQDKHLEMFRWQYIKARVLL